MTPTGFTHDRRRKTTSDEWFTPPELFTALGLRFDLDPAAPSLLVAFGLPCALALAESGLGRTLIVPNAATPSQTEEAACQG